MLQADFEDTPPPVPSPTGAWESPRGMAIPYGAWESPRGMAIPYWGMAQEGVYLQNLLATPLIYPNQCI